MNDDDALTATRLDVAEMKGMLKQALSDHGQRLSNLEKDNTQLHARLSDKGKVMAAHEERIKDLEDSNSQRLGRVLGVIGTIVGLAGLILASLNRFTITP